MDHVQHTAYGGRDQKQVAVIYANNTMSCEALSAAWRAVVMNEHWKIAKNSSPDLGAFYLSKKGIPITVDPGGSTGACPHPEISVGRTG